MPTFLTERMIFVHVPKTGGSWLTHAVRSAGVTTWAPDPLGDQSYSEHGHADLRDVAADERFSVAFIRHPLDWWRSYWGHRMRAGWDPDNGIDAAAANDDFNDFVLALLDHGRGCFDQIVRRFVGLPSPTVDFVGRYEHLVEDTCEALRLGGERFSVSALRGQPHENVNDYSRFPALYRPEVAARLAESEHETIERFYADDPIPAKLLVGADGDCRSIPPSWARRAPAAHDGQRLEQRIRALERALRVSQNAGARIRLDLTQVDAERRQAEHALQSLRNSHLLRYTRTLRTAYYRTRPLSHKSLDVLGASTRAPGHRDRERHSSPIDSGI